MMTFAIASVPIFILGFVIWKFKTVEIIAGYDEKIVTDKDGLAKWVGLSLMFDALIIIGMYFGMKNFDLGSGPKILISVGVLLVLLTVTALGTRRYEKRD